MEVDCLFSSLECELEIIHLRRNEIIQYCHESFDAHGTPMVHDASQIKQKTMHMIFRHLFWTQLFALFFI